MQVDGEHTPQYIALQAVCMSSQFVIVSVSLDDLNGNHRPVFVDVEIVGLIELTAADKMPPIM